MIPVIANFVPDTPRNSHSPGAEVVSRVKCATYAEMCVEVLVVTRNSEHVLPMVCGYVQEDHCVKELAGGHCVVFQMDNKPYSRI